MGIEVRGRKLDTRGGGGNLSRSESPDRLAAMREFSGILVSGTSLMQDSPPRRYFQPKISPRTHTGSIDNLKLASLFDQPDRGKSRFFLPLFRPMALPICSRAQDG